MSTNSRNSSIYGNNEITCGNSYSTLYVGVAYLTLDLEDCGFNVPSVPGSSTVLVQKHLTVTQAQLPVTIYGNNEITCGNSYSTLWHVTAWADSNTKIAGDLNYDLCSSLTNCLGAATPNFDLSAGQPFTGTPPPPGYGSIFSNPIQSQYITQPAPTSINFIGIVDFTKAIVRGLALSVTSLPPSPLTPRSLARISFPQS